MMFGKFWHTTELMPRLLSEEQCVRNRSRTLMACFAILLSSLVSYNAQAAWQWQSTGAVAHDTDPRSSGGGIVIPNPPGLAVGDDVFLVVAYRIGSTGTWTTPAGWNALASGNAALSFYCRKADAALVSAGALQVVGSSSGNSAGVMLRFTGGASSCAPHAITTKMNWSATTDIATNALTITQANALVLEIGLFNWTGAGGGINAYPGGATNRVNVDPPFPSFNFSLAIGSLVQTTATNIPAGIIDFVSTDFTAPSTSILVAFPAGTSSAPTAPTALATTAVSSSQINLSWTASTDDVGVTGYLIERCQGSGCSSYTQIATTTGTTYSDTALSASTSYSYRVRATDATGNLSSYSAATAATTPAPSDTQAPTIPSGLSANAASTSQINLSWVASTDNVSVTGYLLERCQGAGCSAFTQLANITGTSFSDTTLTPATSYSYRVRATDAANNTSNYSSIATATTQAEPDTQAPTAPNGIAATALSGTQISVSWGVATDNVGVTAYLLERCQGAGCSSFNQIASLAGNSYTDSGLTQNTSYSYRVRATDALNNLSGYSTSASATTHYTGPITFTYTYDALGRIIHAAGSDGSSIDYTYDANGNVTTVNRQ